MNNRLVELTAVLIPISAWAAALAPAEVLYSNLGPNNSVCINCGYWDSGSHLPEQPYQRGMPFTAPQGRFELSSITVAAFQPFGFGPATVLLAVRSDSNGLPGSIIEQFTFSGIPGS